MSDRIAGYKLQTAAECVAFGKVSAGQGRAPITPSSSQQRRGFSAAPHQHSLTPTHNLAYSVARFQPET